MSGPAAKPAARRATRADMQSRPRRLSLRLTRLALAAAGLALLVAGTAANVTTFLVEKGELVHDMTVQAQVIADNAAAAMLFGDHDSALETLASLHRTDTVVRATLFDAAGRTFADFRNATGPDSPVASGAPGHRFEHGRLIIVEPVHGKDVAIGQLRFEVTLRPLYARSGLFAAITGVVALVALLLAWLLAVGVRREVDRIEQRLDELAYHDPVTGLFNRHAASEHLQQYVREARRSGAGFSIVTLDLDDFKQINDTLGHEVGDRLLQLVAGRMAGLLQPGARAYRFGGDEFVIVCPCPDGYAEPRRYGALASRLLAGSTFINDIEVALGGSVGVARYPVDGETAEEVLRASDIAMYAAKTRGKNGVVVFDPALRASSESRMRVEQELRQALRDGQLRLHYQPVVDAHSGRLLGAEALVRWQHPERGLVPPQAFIDVAERSGLVVELGAWALGEAARQLVRWANEGLELWVAVNVSARQLRGGMLARQYREAVAVSGCDPESLEIELTEHTLVENVEENLRILTELRDLGARIAIDDFGTGLSSLAYLKRLPIDKIKIDRSFVSDLPSDRSDSAIIAAAASMAGVLGLRVVAEGVETEAQRQAVCALGCDLAQGYLFSKALDPALFAAWARLYEPRAVEPADLAATARSRITGSWRRRGA
ncbi:MAG: EAL domain-containing protein [Steroidobacteraceae bacterium]